MADGKPEWCGGCLDSCVHKWLPGISRGPTQLAVNGMFEAVEKGDKNQVAGAGDRVVASEGQALDAERTKLSLGHQPGDQWTDAKTGAAYSLDQSGNLLEVQNGGKDVTWLGTNGKSFRKDGNTETWTKNGETITDFGDGKYSFVDAGGHSVELSKAEKAAIHKVGETLITQISEIRES